MAATSLPRCAGQMPRTTYTTLIQRRSTKNVLSSSDSGSIGRMFQPPGPTQQQRRAEVVMDLIAAALDEAIIPEAALQALKPYHLLVHRSDTTLVVAVCKFKQGNGGAIELDGDHKFIVAAVPEKAKRYLVAVPRDVFSEHVHIRNLVHGKFGMAGSDKDSVTVLDAGFLELDGSESERKLVPIGASFKFNRGNEAARTASADALGGLVVPRAFAL